MRSLTPKLILAFVAVSLIVAILGAVIIRYTTQQEFSELALNNARNNFINRASTYYRTTGSWQGYAAIFFKQSAAQGQNQPNQQRPPIQGQPQNQPQNQPPQTIPLPDPNNLQGITFMLVAADGRIVIPVRPYRAGEIILDELLADSVAIEVDNVMVGSVITLGEVPPLDQRELRFLERTNSSLIYATLAATAIALVISLVLTRSLTRPLRELTGAIRALPEGGIGQQVQVRTKDEIGQLAQAFNLMSADLARLNEQRRQMTTDIAHDLRSPLTVIGGYVESMRDGVLKPTPERLNAIHDEVQHLERLVDDLRTLSLADAGELSLNRSPIAPVGLLDQVQAAYHLAAENKNLSLTTQAAPNLPHINADPDRLMQVLGNLVSNAIRHTPEGGEISIRCSVDKGQQLSSNSHLNTAHWILFTVIDSGSGIPSDDLSRIFDRFYRVDDSRHGAEGESGLGLAIAKSIVEMHGGEISVESELGLGTTFTISLPL
jgi:two-component system, OmpR family, sensor histidine kinase BaeS